MKFVCTVCGYVYEGDAAPAECPICHAGADKFKKVEDGAMTLAAEHEFGVYASTVKNNPEISDEDKKFIFDQFRMEYRIRANSQVPLHFRIPVHQQPNPRPPGCPLRDIFRQ